MAEHLGRGDDPAIAPRPARSPAADRRAGCTARRPRRDRPARRSVRPKPDAAARSRNRRTSGRCVQLVAADVAAARTTKRTSPAIRSGTRLVARCARRGRSAPGWRHRRRRPTSCSMLSSTSVSAVRAEVLDERLQVGPRRPCSTPSASPIVAASSAARRATPAPRTRPDRRGAAPSPGPGGSCRRPPGPMRVTSRLRRSPTSASSCIEARPVVDERVERERRARPGRDGRAAVRRGVDVRAGVPLERRPFLTRESEAIGEGDRGVESRPGVDAPFEVADRPGADERPGARAPPGSAPPAGGSAEASLRTSHPRPRSRV